MISLNRITGNWNELKGRLKQALASLTDNDLMFDDGKKDKLLGRLQIIVGKTGIKRTGTIPGISIR
jgi:uncharacterized protein YjbJ (UPF0337 family)